MTLASLQGEGDRTTDEESAPKGLNNQDLTLMYPGVLLCADLPLSVSRLDQLDGIADSLNTRPPCHACLAYPAAGALVTDNRPFLRGCAPCSYGVHSAICHGRLYFASSPHRALGHGRSYRQDAERTDVLQRILGVNK